MLDHAAYSFQTRKGMSEDAGRLVLGMAPREACDFLGRIFNLCKHAQIAAAELALGEPSTVQAEQLFEEIRKEHIFTLSLKLTRLFEFTPIGLSAEKLLPRGLPQTPQEFEDFLTSGLGAAPLLQRIETLFPAGVGVADLPMVDASKAIRKTACENSVAVRNHAHPVMQYISQTRGKGPLWRVFARLVDLSADLPLPKIDQGVAMVPAARGLYAVRGEVLNGVVMKLERVTPTDHLLANEGVLEKCLMTLPADQLSLAKALVEILDPCQPVEVVGGLQYA